MFTLRTEKRTGTEWRLFGRIDNVDASNRIAQGDMMDNKAYILRINVGNDGSLQDALDTDTIVIGWAKAASLIDEKLNREEFRQALINSYPDYGNNLRSAGNAAGNMWRFIREMKPG